MIPKQFLMVANFELKDYTGGTNPLLIYLFFFIIGLLITAAIVRIGIEIWKKNQFRLRALSSGLTFDEMSRLNNLLDRLHVTKRLETITQIHEFDNFIHRISKIYEGMILTDDRLIDEIAAFSSIRNKLGMRHLCRNAELKNTLCLPVGQKISLKYLDRDTDLPFHFHSAILENNDFYLGIAPPERQISKELFGQASPQVEVSWVGDNQITYIFQSKFVRFMQGDKEMWFIQHSKEIEKMEGKGSLKIPGTFMPIKDDSGALFSEYPTTITNLNQKECLFSSSTTANLQVGNRVLIGFDLEEHAVSARVEITEVLNLPSGIVCKGSFIGLGQEETRLILEWVIREKKKDQSGKKHHV
jgi:hypothetical protein